MLINMRRKLMNFLRMLYNFLKKLTNMLRSLYSRRRMLTNILRLAINIIARIAATSACAANRCVKIVSSESELKLFLEKSEYTPINNRMPRQYVFHGLIKRGR